MIYSRLVRDIVIEDASIVRVFREM